MDTIFKIWNLVDRFWLDGIFMAVIIILLTKRIFRNKIDTEISLNSICGIVIIHSIVYILLFISTILFDSDSISLKRAFGPHWWAYWTMMFFNSILPLILVFKKIRKNNFYLLVVSILMNIGWLFESFIIHITSIERDYMPENFQVEINNPFLPTFQEVSTLTHGILIGILLLILSNLYNWIINRNPKAEHPNY